MLHILELYIRLNIHMDKIIGFILETQQIIKKINGNLLNLDIYFYILDMMIINIALEKQEIKEYILN